MKLLQLILFMMTFNFGFLCIYPSDEVEKALKTVNLETTIKTVGSIVIFKTIDIVEVNSRKNKSQSEIHDTQLGLTLFKSSITISQACFSGGIVPIICSVGYLCYSLRSKMAEQEKHEDSNLEMLEKKNKMTSCKYL